MGGEPRLNNILTLNWDELLARYRHENTELGKLRVEVLNYLADYVTGDELRLQWA